VVEATDGLRATNLYISRECFRNAIVCGRFVNVQDVTQPTEQPIHGSKAASRSLQGTGTTMSGQQLTEHDFLQPMGIHIPCQLSDSLRGLVNREIVE
jgi:hypothetical protein